MKIMSTPTFFEIDIFNANTAGMGSIRRDQSTKTPKMPARSDIVLKLKNCFVTAASVNVSPCRGVDKTNTMMVMVVKKMVEMVAPIITKTLTHRKGWNNS